MRGGLSAGVKSATDQFSASELEEALDLATSFHVLTDEEAAAARARVAAGESSFDREITALESSLEGVLGLKASGAKAQRQRKSHDHGSGSGLHSSKSTRNNRADRASGGAGGGGGSQEGGRGGGGAPAHHRLLWRVTGRHSC